MHHSIPLLLSLFFNRLNILNHLPSINSGPEQVEGNDLNLVLLLPAAAQGSVELHHRIQLPSPRAGQQQLLVEELLIGDQNL